MKATLALTRMYVKLAARERGALFFNYVFPLIFFFVFGQFMGAQPGGAITRIVTMVLVIGILGNGLFGAGLRAVIEREANILRRFKVAPITPAPMLVAMIIAGWLLYMPGVLVVLGLAHFVYGMPWPERWLSLLALVTVGSWTFRSIGLIIAAVANSMAESNILIQLIYMPMLFISGATFPVSMLPNYAQVAAQFLPASYLNTGLQRVLLRAEGIESVAGPILAMLASMVVATFVSIKLFRWEKDEKLPRSSKLWVIGVLLPFLGMGVWQAYSREHINQSKRLDREVRRNQPRLIRDARIFTADGRVIDNGAVLIRDGRIDQIYEAAPPDPKLLRADVVEAAGKTLLPGLIDVHVHLGSSGGLSEDPRDHQAIEGMSRALAAHLYAGVTAVGSAGDSPTEVQKLRRRVDDGDRVGAELFLVSAGGGPEPAGAGVLAAAEAFSHLATGRPDLLGRSLVAQVAPAAMLAAARKRLAQDNTRFRGRLHGDPPDVESARASLLNAWRAGVPLVTGSDAGYPLVFHGAALHRELQLWVEAGVPPAVALQAATANAARLLGAGNRIGRIRKGFEATLLLVDGNPLQDIAATERISALFLKGERIDRPGLFEQE